MAESLHILLGTSACLQWLCHSGEQTVARGPLVINCNLLFEINLALTILYTLSFNHLDVTGRDFILYHYDVLLTKFPIWQFKKVLNVFQNGFNS